MNDPSSERVEFCEACLYKTGLHSWFCVRHPQAKVIALLSEAADEAATRVYMEIPIA